MLVFHQNQNSVRITTSYNSTLNSWVRNQITNIKKLKEKNNEMPFWKYHEDRYIGYLNKVGLDWPPKNPWKILDGICCIYLLQSLKGVVSQLKN
jgi:hypothetical protein